MKTKTINQPEQNFSQEQANAQRPGFFTSVMPVLSKDGQYVRFFLADMTVTEHANRFKGLLGLDYVRKEPTERPQEFIPRVGLHAKVKIFVSQDKQWVSVVLPGNLGRITNHVNAYKHIFGVPYERKAPKAAA